MADHDLGQAYFAVRAANTDPAYRASLRTDSWILQRNAECQLPKYTVVTDGHRPAFVDCLLDEYAERIADLIQMKRHKQTDPNLISHPIRQSFLASGGTAGTPVSLVFSSLQLPSGSSGMPLLAWRADGGLLLLSADSTDDGMLYVWARGNLRPFTKVPQAVRFDRICALDDGTIALLPADGPTAGWIGGDKIWRKARNPPAP